MGDIWLSYNFTSSLQHENNGNFFSGVNTMSDSTIKGKIPAGPESVGLLEESECPPFLQSFSFCWKTAYAFPYFLKLRYCIYT